jgi:branched-chain amino acid transport system ATP-binding protein
MSADSRSDTTGGVVETDAPALEVSGIEVAYGATTVLRGVDLTVPSGKVVALLGPNGAGKTTLLRTVSGLNKPTAGTVRLHGEDVTRTGTHSRCGDGLIHIPEGRGVFRGLTVRENLVMQSPRGQERDAIEKAVSAFPILGSRLGQTAGTLSGGQQQMLAMSAAYVRDARLILVDEPSLGLAPIIVDEIFAFLAGLITAGRSLLMVDQFVAKALAMSDDVYVLKQGRVVHHGPAGSLTTEELAEQYLGGAA